MGKEDSAQKEHNKAQEVMEQVNQVILGKGLQEGTVYARCDTLGAQENDFAQYKSIGMTQKVRERILCYK